MGRDIGQLYKHSQSHLSTFPLKAPDSSSSDPQKSPAIELSTTHVPIVTDKIKTIMFCIPKITSRMMQPSQTMTTNSLVKHQKRKL